MRVACHEVPGPIKPLHITGVWDKFGLAPRDAAASPGKFSAWGGCGDAM
jgi:hypothetical protein